MTTIKAILIPADEQKQTEVVEFDQDDLDAMQRYVGGYVQFVEGRRPNITFVFNEEGKVKGMELNRLATLVLWTHRSEFRGEDALVGDVLIIGPADEDTGDSTGVPDELIELFFNTERYRYLVKTFGDKTWNGNGVTYENWPDAYNYAQSLARRWTLVEEVKIVAA